jgi:hypothetical protein
LKALFVDDPKGTAKAAFKAFAKFKFAPLIQINLKQVGDELKLKNVKVLGISNTRIKTIARSLRSRR